jgi:hypothetical protein
MVTSGVADPEMPSSQVKSHLLDNARDRSFLTGSPWGSAAVDPLDDAAAAAAEIFDPPAPLDAAEGLEGLTTDDASVLSRSTCPREAQRSTAEQSIAQHSIAQVQTRHTR